MDALERHLDRMEENVDQTIPTKGKARKRHGPSRENDKGDSK
jgi:hypothetical protein